MDACRFRRSMRVGPTVACGFARRDGGDRRSSTCSRLPDCLAWQCRARSGGRNRWPRRCRQRPLPRPLPRRPHRCGRSPAAGRGGRSCRSPAPKTPGVPGGLASAAAANTASAAAGAAALADDRWVQDVALPTDSSSANNATTNAAPANAAAPIAAALKAAAASTVSSNTAPVAAGIATADAVPANPVAAKFRWRHFGLEAWLARGTWQAELAAALGDSQRVVATNAAIVLARDGVGRQPSGAGAGGGHRRRQLCVRRCGLRRSRRWSCAATPAGTDRTCAAGRSADCNFCARLRRPTFRRCTRSCSRR